VFYVIVDTSGKRLDSFWDAGAAESALRAMVETEPDLADEVLLLTYSDEGEPVEPARMLSDLPLCRVFQPVASGAEVWGYAAGLPGFASSSHGYLVSGPHLIFKAAAKKPSGKVPA
jgi:hypothetical protein